MKSTRKLLLGFSALAVGGLLSNLVYDTIMTRFDDDDCSSGGDGSPTCPFLRLGDDFGDLEIQRLMDGLRASRGRPTTLVIHTCGGDVSHVARLAEAVHTHGDVEVWVPYRALSGGALVALAAQKIVMWPDACLGPVDPQLLVGFIGFFSAHTLEQVIADKGANESDEFWLASRAEGSRVLNDVKQMLERYDVPTRGRERLLNTQHSHGFPIFFDEAQALGLPVERPAPGVVERHHLIDWSQR